VQIGHVFSHLQKPIGKLAATSRATFYMSALPVIFLAFANDKVETARYLRNLPLELEGIRKALAKAQQAGLCEVVERANASVDNLIDVFQEYQERVCVFHYGGHADGYRLLLERFGPGQAAGNQEAHGEGLVSFLAKQPGLKLIFFNGCSTQQQTLELVRAGIPAVVGTSMAIADDLATDLAVRFYAGLASGLNLDRAWSEAADSIVIRKGSANVRGMYREEDDDDESGKAEVLAERFPWEVYYREGSEAVKDWNLPVAANNPLFGLPPIPPGYLLPDRPFLYLKRYEREHARLFFGRSHYISNLYKLVTDRKSAPIVLMYGQAGVGKSSLLDAGLLPRLEATHEVVYIRRAQEKGLLGTLEEGLGLSQERLNVRQLELIAQDYQGEVHTAFQAFLDKLRGRLTAAQRGRLSDAELEDYLLRRDLLKFWLALEHELGKPLIVILDQAEEMYTRPLKPEAAKLAQAGSTSRPVQHAHPEFGPFLNALVQLFANPALMPQGKLLLSYRKEYHPEIEEGLKMYGLPRSYLFLEQLKARDIVEIFRAFCTQPDLLQRYGIGLEQGLAEALGADLTAAPDSPVAPLLQIVLSRLWDEHLTNPTKLFTFADYAALQRFGISIYDFFAQQLDELRAWNPDLVNTGFVLDFLRYHITDLGTSASRQVEELRRLYQHRQEDLDALIERSHTLSLLALVRPGTYMLAHDTLAPEVLREFNESDKEAQRAARILASKLADIESVHSNEDLDAAQAQREIDEIFVAETDLAVVERGLNWMRQASPEEAALLERSRQKRRQAENKRKRVYASLGVLGVLVVASMVLAFRLWRSAERSLARAQASQLMARAIQLTDVEPTLATRVAEAAWKLNPSALIEKDLLKIVNQQATYRKKIELSPELLYNFTLPSPDGRAYATVDYDGLVPQLIDENGRELVKFKGSPHQATISCMAFSPDGRRLLTGSNDSTAKLWSVTGELLQTLKYHRGPLSFVGFSPSGTTLLTGSQDQSAAVWDPDGRLKRYLPGHNAGVYVVAASPDGTRVVTADGTQGESIRVWDMGGQLLHAFAPPGYIGQLSFTPDSEHLFIVSNSLAAIIDLAGGIRTQLDPPAETYFQAGLLLPDGKTVITSGQEIRSWWLDGYGPEFTPRLTGVYKHTPVERGVMTRGLHLLNNGGFVSLSDAFYEWDLGGHAQQVTYQASATGLVWPKGSASFATYRYPPQDLARVELGRWHYDPAKPHLADSGWVAAPLGVMNLVFSPNLTYALGETATDSLLVLDLQGRLLYHIDLTPGDRRWNGSAGGTLISPNDSLIATTTTTDRDGVVARLFDRRGKWLYDLSVTSPGLNMQFSPDSRHLVTLDYTGLKKWDLATGKVGLEVASSNFLNLAGLSPSGQKALVGTPTSVAIVDLVNVNALPVELPSNGNYPISFAYSPVRDEVLVLRSDRTVTRWSAQGERLAVYPISFFTEEPNQIFFSGDGGHFVVSTPTSFSVYSLSQDLGALFASGQIARFDAIDFAEAQVPVPLQDLDTLTSPADLARVANYYVNQGQVYDFGDLDDEERLERAEAFFEKSIKTKRLAKAVEGLADLYLLRNKKFDLLALLTEQATTDDLRSHVDYLRVRLATDSAQSPKFAPVLKAISLQGIGQQRNPTFVEGVLLASRYLRELVPKTALDTLFTANNVADLRQYAFLASEQYQDRGTRKENMQRAAQLWQKLLTGGQATPQLDDSLNLAAVQSRLAWYYLSDGEFADAEAALGKVERLNANEPHQYPNRALLYLLTGRTEQARRLYQARRNDPFEPMAPDGRKFAEVFAQSAQSLRTKGILKTQHDQVLRGW
jgi:WD40 repeat protein